MDEKCKTMQVNRKPFLSPCYAFLLFEENQFSQDFKKFIFSTQVVAAKPLPEIMLLKSLLKEVINLLIPVSYFVTIQAYYYSFFMHSLSPNHQNNKYFNS